MRASYFQYWGKADPAYPAEPKWHLLPYHCLDVAAVVAVWWKSSSTIRRSFSKNNRLSEEQVRAWVLFFTTLHDYGKFDIRFQLKNRAAWESLHPLAGACAHLPSKHDCHEYWHGENGLSWFKQDFFAYFKCGKGESFFLGDDEPPQWPSWKPWIETVTGHHGHVKDAEYVSEAALSSICDSGLADIDRTTRTKWLEDVAQIFLSPVGLSLIDNPPLPSPLMAGLCSVADWLASRCDTRYFSYQGHAEALLTYFERKVKEDANRIFVLSGIRGSAKSYGGVRRLLPEQVDPRLLQTRIDDLPLEPGLTIIEAPTGSGKTEAALAYAWRLLTAGLADSIVFALPTQATANAMLKRLENLSAKLFEDSPNLLLAHGLARFNKSFMELKRKGLNDKGESDGWAQCGKWLAESRKRIFLGQIGVCTVDQVLISVLPVRHRFVRGFGVGRSVLIVDEVHAYDAYMYGLLEEVLRQQRAAGSAAILLSATLSAAQKRQLCAIWRIDESHERENAPYPLMTWVGEGESMCLSLESHEQPKPSQINIECLRIEKMEPNGEILKRIVAAMEKGAQVAVICNLVDTAQRIVSMLRQMTSAQVDLFHARYRFKDRQKIEDDAIRRFGPKGNRDYGRILVATQVVEQSLDLDFDWIVTQICPVDLLFQRMGRLHRHERKGRPEGFTKPICTVLLSENGDYGLTGKIYANIRALWRTEQKLVNSPDGMVIFPIAYRDWIEAVYQSDAWGTEPDYVEKDFAKFKTDTQSKHYCAKQMIQRAFEVTPFADSDESVTAVTRDSEMNLTVIPYVESPKGRRLLDGELVDSLDDFQKPEEIARNSIGVPKGWGDWLKALCEVDEEKRYWLAMTDEGEAFVREGNNVVFRYHRDTGLEVQK